MTMCLLIVTTAANRMCVSTVAAAYSLKIEKCELMAQNWKLTKNMFVLSSP